MGAQQSLVYNVDKLKVYIVATNIVRRMDLNGANIETTFGNVNIKKIIPYQNFLICLSVNNIYYINLANDKNITTINYPGHTFYNGYIHEKSQTDHKLYLAAISDSGTTDGIKVIDLDPTKQAENQTTTISSLQIPSAVGLVYIPETSIYVLGDILYFTAENFYSYNLTTPTTAALKLIDKLSATNILRSIDASIIANVTKIYVSYGGADGDVGGVYQYNATSPTVIDLPFGNFPVVKVKYYNNNIYMVFGNTNTAGIRSMNIEPALGAITSMEGSAGRSFNDISNTVDGRIAFSSISNGTYISDLNIEPAVLTTVNKTTFLANGFSICLTESCDENECGTDFCNYCSTVNYCNSGVCTACECKINEKCSYDGCISKCPTTCAAGTTYCNATLTSATGDCVTCGCEINETCNSIGVCATKCPTTCAAGTTYCNATLTSATGACTTCPSCPINKECNNLGECVSVCSAGCIDGTHYCDSTTELCKSCGCNINETCDELGVCATKCPTTCATGSYCNAKFSDTTGVCVTCGCETNQKCDSLGECSSKCSPECGTLKACGDDGTCSWTMTFWGIIIGAIILFLAIVGTLLYVYVFRKMGKTDALLGKKFYDPDLEQLGNNTGYFS